MNCALCNYKFDKSDLACHSQCPLANACAIICCPNCGYQVVDESKSGAASLARKLKEVFSQWQTKITEASSK